MRLVHGGVHLDDDVRNRWHLIHKLLFYPVGNPRGLPDSHVGVDIQVNLNDG